MQNDKNDSKVNIRKATALMALVLLIAVLVEAGITYFVLRKNVERTTDMLLSQVEIVLGENEEQEKAQLEDLKKNYMVEANAAAYILAEKNININDINELERVASLLSVDELHIFDDTGTIIAGTKPQYYGYSFDSGAQMAYFKPMLEDKTLSLCQDVVPNTAERRNMMYAATWDSDGKYIIQVGVEPTRLFETLADHELERVFNGIPTSDGYDIVAVYMGDMTIAGATKRELVNRTIPKELRQLFLKYSYEGEGLLNYNGAQYYCNFKPVGNYIINISYDVRKSRVLFFVPLLIIVLYLFIAELVIYSLFVRLQKTEEKKNAELRRSIKEITKLNESLTEQNDTITKQYSLLISMSQVFYSMHLLDLKENTVEPYKADFEVKDISERTEGGAVEAMKKVIEGVVKEECLADALEFTDLTTLAERMKGTRFLSAEFVGNRIGWFLAAFIAVEQDEEGRPLKVVFSTRSIDNVKKKEEMLLRNSTTDELTGVYNRRAYEERIKELKREGIPDDFVYVSFDVNGLKVINDTIGHEAGDELIIGASRCIKMAIGLRGDVYRTGGDEFIGIMNADDKAVAEFEHSIEENCDTWRGKKVDSLTISYGMVRRVSEPDLSMHDIAVLADKRMYEAKSMHYRKLGIDRRGQRDAHIALLNLYTKILRINITEDTYQILNMYEDEQTEQKGFANSISEWLTMFGRSGQVHSEDLEEYLKLSDLGYMREFFKSGKSSLRIFYRRKYEQGFMRVMMEIIPANDYSDDNQSLYLYVKNIE